MADAQDLRLTLLPAAEVVDADAELDAAVAAALGPLPADDEP